MKFTKKTLKKRRSHVKIKAMSNRPRLVVSRSLNHISAQVIDDQNNITLAQASSISLKERLKKTDAAREVGEMIAKKAIEKKIRKVSFDRSGYKYHGRIKALAEAARNAGLVF